MIQALIHFLRPPIFDEPETTRTAAQLHYVVLAGIFTASSIALFNYIVDVDLPTVATLIPAFAAIALAGLYLLLRNGKTYLVTFLIISIGYISVTSSLLLSGDGIRDSSASIFPLLLILSSVFLGSKATLRFGILSLGIIASIWFAEFFDLLETNFDNESSTALLVLITAVSFATLFLRRTVNRIVEGGAKIREQAAALEANNRELQQAQLVLQRQTVELSNLNHELKAEIAERERTEAALRQRQKQESIGLLAGGVAHDFNNLLTSMLSQSSLALRKLEPEHAARQNIEKAINSARRGEDLTRQLLAYAGHSNFLVEPVDLNKLVQANVSLLESLIQHWVALKFNLASRLPAIEADRGQIQQILMNLVINASQAIEHDHGLIRLVTTTKNMTSEELIEAGVKTIAGEVPAPNQYVILSVEDNGHGMDAGTQEKVYDPFFTTKETGHGLGLSAIAGIVRALEGGLSIRSQVKQGTVFTIYFPASHRQPLPISTHAALPKISTYSGTILVIDDEEAILDSLGEIFQTVGYKTLTAASGNEGVAQFRQYYQSVDLILLDIHMPGLNGLDAFHQMRAIKEDVPVIFSSGYTDVELPSRTADVNSHDFLSKPYNIETLLDKVNRKISSPNEG